MNGSKVFVFNVKCTPKIAFVEGRIRALETVQDTSRAAILKRAVAVAKDVNNWADIYTNIVNKISPDQDTLNITGWQARCDEETGKRLEEIREKMYNDLISEGIITKVLQNQLLLLALLANYHECLKKRQSSDLEIERKFELENNNISIPETAYIFSQLVLTDPDSDALREIKAILANWRKSYNR